MELLLAIGFMILIGWVAIKSLKVVFWIVGVVLLANFLSVGIGCIATIIVLAILALSHKKVTDGFIIFLCLALLFGIIF